MESREDLPKGGMEISAIDSTLERGKEASGREERDKNSESKESKEKGGEKSFKGFTEQEKKDGEETSNDGEKQKEYVAGEDKDVEKRKGLRNQKKANEGKKDRDDNCKKCKVTPKKSMITCDACKKWLCQICADLKEDQMKEAEDETNRNKHTKNLPGLKWICSICWNNIVKSEKMLKGKIIEINKQEEKLTKLEKEVEEKNTEIKDVNNRIHRGGLL